MAVVAHAGGAMIAEELLKQNGIKLASTAPGRHYATCPKCSAGRTLHNQGKKVLGVTIDDKGACWQCSHCGWTGPEKGTGNGRAGDNLTTYDYRNAGGAVVFQKVRAYDKDGKKFFWLRRPDGRGGFINGAKGCNTKLIYRLPEVIEATALDHTVLVVEGEKDVDALWAIGIPATCNAHGASEPDKKPKWYRAHSEQLRGADVIVIPDNDPAGRYHADTTASLSRGIAQRIRLLDLAKHWPAIPTGGDVSDWLAAGHTREELDALIALAPEWSLQQADVPQREASEAAPDVGTNESKLPAQTLAEVHAVFQKWFGKEYDLDAASATIAAAASERLPGDPLWLLLVAGPGGAKTETVQALAGAGAYVTSTISSEGALLSATPRKQRVKKPPAGCCARSAITARWSSRTSPRSSAPTATPAPASLPRSAKSMTDAGSATSAAMAARR